MKKGKKTAMFRFVRAFALQLSLLGAFAALWPGRVAASGLPYETYYRDGFGQTVKTQAAYLPAGLIKLDFNGPQDLFVDEKDHIYVADTGNNRIVHLDRDGTFVREIVVPESPLSRPSGVFVDGNGDIYVADTGNARIVRLNAEGRLVKAFGRPASAYIPDSFKYEPVRVVVDKRGFLFVTSLGAYQGLVQLDPDGGFVGFFGPNKAPFTLFDAFKRLVYTREMYAREPKKRPPAVTSADIDRDGFIYTVTREATRDQIKRLNMAGVDQLPGKGDFHHLQPVRSYGEILHPRSDSPSPQLVDLTVDDDGNVTVVDAVHDVVSQYDRNGNLLFFWGTEMLTAAAKTGVVRAPAAIDQNSAGDLLILDGTNNLIHVLRRSEFGSLVHRANALTQAGRYEESEPLWEEVHRLNERYTPALIGLAKAAYKKERFDRAQELFHRAGVVGGYSESFWQNRLRWFQRHFGLAMNGLAGAALLAFAIRKVRRRRRTGRTGAAERTPAAIRPGNAGSGVSVAAQLKHAFTVLRHPADGFYAIRHEGKAGAAGSLVLFVLAMAAFAFIQAKTAFVFNPWQRLGVELPPLLVQFAGIWIGWVVSNYLTGSLFRGEGRFRDVLYGSAYALFPLVLIGVPKTVLSHALTLNEAALFRFLDTVMMVWIALLFIRLVQGVHNYAFSEAVAVTAASLLALAVLVAMLFILLGLGLELVQFLKSIYQEVIVR